LTVAGSIGSLKLAVTFAPGLTPVPPFAGATSVTVGGVVSGAPPPVSKTTSTQ
jgi:hypothetical protein